MLGRFKGPRAGTIKYLYKKHKVSQSLIEERLAEKSNQMKMKFRDSENSERIFDEQLAGQRKNLEQKLKNTRMEFYDPKKTVNFRPKKAITSVYSSRRESS